jgi:hypothetical protein
MLPESWGVGKKAAFADALIALSVVNKAAEPGQWTHDPEMLKAVEDGWVEAGSTVVCTVTGHGLKDPDTALRDVPTVTAVPVDTGAVVAALGLV